MPGSETAERIAHHATTQAAGLQEARRVCLVGQERLDLGAERGVPRTRTIEVGGAFGGWQVQRIGQNCLGTFEAAGRHGRILAGLADARQRSSRARGFAGRRCVTCVAEWTQLELVGASGFEPLTPAV